MGPDPEWNLIFLYNWIVGLLTLPTIGLSALNELWDWWYGENRPYCHLGTLERARLFPIAVWYQFCYEGE